ncbi:MAG: polysaccharide biosynthesis protein [Crocinitomicaceae bacterium]|nr:polysaccharide biosynthesis protein [Crocinitomicaceae bacterium]
MSTLKKLAGQTAVYGLSTIFGRLLNYALVPLHVWIFAPAEFGVVGEFYAYATFLAVLLTFGLETTYFRFVSKSGNEEKTYTEIFSIILILNGIFLILGLLFSQAIANVLLYPQYQYIVMVFVVILVIDACTALPLARLRQQNQARKFALVNLSSIGAVILFNLIFILYAKRQVDGGDASSLASVLYSPAIGIGYVFIANLLGSLVKPLMLLNDLKKFKFSFPKADYKTYLMFAAPIALAGLAGMVNEAIDRPLLKYIVYAQSNDLEFASAQVGVYSANYKLSIIITLVIQAFRYAAEPFFFAQEKNADRAKIYSRVMTWFVIVVVFIFLSVSLSLDIFKWFLPKPAYWEGLHVVPVLLLANVFLGIYYNQSIWYKLADKPLYGAWIAVGGALMTLVLNFIFIPFFGYTGAAWATLFVYASMTAGSWYFGQKHYPIKYNLRKIALYLSVAIILCLLGLWLQGDQVTQNLLIGFIFSALFIGLVLFIERPLSSLRKTYFI